MHCKFCKFSVSIIILLLVIVVLLHVQSRLFENGATAQQDQQNVQIFKVSQQDLDGDNLPELTIIDCAFITEHDQVRIYDKNGDMQAGNSWGNITDFRDDVWIFDVKSDGTAQLIINFISDNEEYIAEIYDDNNEDGRVNYREVEGKIVVQESSSWHVKVVSNRNWQDTNNLSAATFKFTINKYLEDPFSINKDNETITGNIDISDNDGDGIIDYQLQHTEESALGTELNGSYRSMIFTKVTGDLPTPYSQSIFWPLLISIHSYEDYRYFDHTPAIAMNWDSGNIEKIGILGFPIENGYHIYSFLPILKGSINLIDYENPMAYYDIANDKDGWPELQVRFNVAVPNDPYFPDKPYTGKVQTPNIEVNYSWDQNNDDLWDYKINLSTNYLITDVLSYPDFGIQTLSYNEIIPFISNKKWDVAMLVFDGKPTKDSEGMFNRGWRITQGYESGKGYVPSGLNSQYMMGFSDSTPDENYNNIEEFMRGEYNFRYFDIPKIYLSTYDHLLHLYNATSGVWNLGKNKSIRYANTDGDAYLDQWTVEQEGEAIQQVNFNDGIYMFSGNNYVLIKQTTEKQAIFVTQPPGSNAEWNELGRELKINQIFVESTDLLGMLERISGEDMQIFGATINNFRPYSGGFQFDLTLQPNYQVIGPDWLGVIGYAPGSYLVVYESGFQSNYLPLLMQSNINPASGNTQAPIILGGSFMVEQLSPVNLKMEMTTQRDRANSLNSSNSVNLSITNISNQDSEEMKVSLVAICADKSMDVFSEAVRILGSEQKTWPIFWQDLATQDCQLVGKLESNNGELLATNVIDIPATTNQSTLEKRVLDNSFLSERAVPIFGVLGLVGILTGAIWWHNRRSDPGEAIE